jgi:hypothetical protein
VTPLSRTGFFLNEVCRIGAGSSIPLTVAPTLLRRSFFCRIGKAARLSVDMATPSTVELSYAELRKECLEAVRQWPGCETISGIQIIRENTTSGFSVRVTLYGQADKKTANRAIACVQREKRRHFSLTE